MWLLYSVQNGNFIWFNLGWWFYICGCILSVICRVSYMTGSFLMWKSLQVAGFTNTGEHHCDARPSHVSPPVHPAHLPRESLCPTCSGSPSCADSWLCQPHWWPCSYKPLIPASRTLSPPHHTHYHSTRDFKMLLVLFTHFLALNIQKYIADRHLHFINPHQRHSLTGTVLPGGPSFPPKSPSPALFVVPSSAWNACPNQLKWAHGRNSPGDLPRNYACLLKKIREFFTWPS